MRAEKGEVAPAIEAAFREELQQQEPWTSTLRMLAIFSCLAGCGFGYDTGNISAVLIQIRDEFHLSTSQQEWVVSCTTLAAAIGSVACAPINHSFGRRPTIVVACALYLMGSAMVPSAGSFAALIGGRTVLGLAIGFSSATVPMYASELAPRGRRGVIVLMHDFSIVLGQLVAGILNGGFYYADSGWRWSTGLAAVPALLLLLAVMPLPESPRWLVRHARYDEARAALRAVAGEGNDKVVTAELQEVRHERSLLHLATPLGALRPHPCPPLCAFSQHCSQATLACSHQPTPPPPLCVSRAQIRDTLAAESAPRGGLVALWGETNLRRAAMLGVALMALNQLSGINTIM